MTGMTWLWWCFEDVSGSPLQWVVLSLDDKKKAVPSFQTSWPSETTMIEAQWSPISSWKFNELKMSPMFFFWISISVLPISASHHLFCCQPPGTFQPPDSKASQLRWITSWYITAAPSEVENWPRPMLCDSNLLGCTCPQHPMVATDPQIYVISYHIIYIYCIYSYIIWGYYGEYVNFCMFLWLSLIIIIIYSP